MTSDPLAGERREALARPREGGRECEAERPPDASRECERRGRSAGPGSA